MRWETLGNAAQLHRSWYHWPYEQRFHIKVNDADVSEDLIRVDQVEQQFDFRQVKVSSPFANIERLDMMVSGRQWTTALRITNPLASPAKILAEFEWTGSNKEPLDVRTFSDQDNRGFAYSRPDGPPILVAISPGGGWEKRNDQAVCNRWEITLEAGKTATVSVSVHIGWSTMPKSEDAAVEDGAPGVPSTDKQAAIDFREDRDGFRHVTTGLGVKSISERWDDLQSICEARRRFLYDRMPRLVGFAPEWAGMWSYVFDLCRSGIYPAQGNFKDVWMVADLVVYREPYVWDGPAAVHTFCNFDADLAARTLRTYLAAATQPDGSLPVSANPYRPFPNVTPQLANNTMALWDCYQITHDSALLAECYPLLVRHIRWIESKRNRTPNGPLLDIGWNIDYGIASLHDSPTIWPDVQFFLVDHYRRLSQIATVIGKPEKEREEWAEKANRLAKAIRKHMWDDKSGTFWCVTDKLEFRTVPQPIEFYGMVTGVASREQAQRSLVRLNDPAKYAPSAKYPFGLPSITFDSPAFKVTDGWSGTIFPIETYYTVRGLVEYGYQDEAVRLARNLYWMMARWYRETGTVWEQYDPQSGMDLNSIGVTGAGRRDVGRGYFISGITTCIGDTLLRGIFGFERTDSPSAFYLTPRPLFDDWHGIEHLHLSSTSQLSIRIKENVGKAACEVIFSGLENSINSVALHRIDLKDGTKTMVKSMELNERREVQVNLEKSNGCRYLWELR